LPGRDDRSVDSMRAQVRQVTGSQRASDVDVAFAESMAAQLSVEVLLVYRGISQRASFTGNTTTDAIYDEAARMHRLKGQRVRLIVKGMDLKRGMALRDSPVIGTRGDKLFTEHVQVLATPQPPAPSPSPPLPLPANLFLFKRKVPIKQPGKQSVEVAISYKGRTLSSLTALDASTDQLFEAARRIHGLGDEFEVSLLARGVRLRLGEQLTASPALMVQRDGTVAVNSITVFATPRAATTTAKDDAGGWLPSIPWRKAALELPIAYAGSTLVATVRADASTDEVYNAAVKLHRLRPGPDFKLIAKGMRLDKGMALADSPAVSVVDGKLVGVSVSAVGASVKAGLALAANVNKALSRGWRDLDAELRAANREKLASETARKAMEAALHRAEENAQAMQRERDDAKLRFERELNAANTARLEAEEALRAAEYAQRCAEAETELQVARVQELQWKLNSMAEHRRSDAGDGAASASDSAMGVVVPARRRGKSPGELMKGVFGGWRRRNQQK